VRPATVFYWAWAVLCLAPRAALAQMPMNMPMPTNLNVSDAAPFGPPVDDQQLYLHGLLSQFEGRLGADSGFRWEGEGWAGDDDNRLVVKSEGEVSDGRVEDGQQELFYSRPISTYFDLQAGARYDLDAGTGRAWSAFGVEGLAPYFFTVSATAYASDAGHYAAKLQVSNALRLTQRLILEPEAELNFYTRSDPARRLGSGLSDLDAGLRLRYEISRKFAPYVGAVWEPKFGETADLTRAAGLRSNGVRIALGIRSWF
jgi:copper resistance protein B